MDVPTGWRYPVKTRRVLLWLAGVLLGMGAPFAQEESGMIWPQEWTVFGPFADGMSMPAKEEVQQLTTPPATLSAKGITCPGKNVTLKNNTVDFTELFGPLPEDTDGAPAAYLMGEITCDRPQKLVVGCGADWWMCWYLDGKPVFSTLPGGNQNWRYACSNQVFSCELTPGKHLLVAFVISGSQGWRLVFDRGEQYLEQNRLEQAQLAEEQKQQAQWIKDNSRANSRMKLVVYGSSVASGAGAKKGRGWAARLADALQERNWEVVNRSIGGDNTTKLLARFARDLLPEKPDVVILGLSLANEGLATGDPETIYAQYRANLQKLIQLCQKNGILPVVTNCYPNDRYQPVHYNYLRKFNEELGGWPVASIDFLSAVDCGDGHWFPGTMKDAGHPNDLGHQEMFSAIPLTLFDSLLATTGARGLSVCPAPSPEIVAESAETSRYEYRTPNSLHHFSLLFTLRAPVLPRQTVTLVQTAGVQVTLSPDGLLHLLAAGQEAAPNALKIGRETLVGVVHRYLKREVILYAGSEKVAVTLPERQLTGELQVTQPGGLGLQNLCLYRSALDEFQIRACGRGNYPHASLEVFSPLNDAYLMDGLPVCNQAGSLEQFRLKK